jgi:DNA-binding transcriptional ArsR family regulator
VSDDEAVFAALADATRRLLLDTLFARSGLTQGELTATTGVTRQATSKHLAVLERAGLVVTIRHGREKHHYLNAAPIAGIAVRWISKYERGTVLTLADLERTLESESDERRGFRLRDDDPHEP